MKENACYQVFAAASAKEHTKIIAEEAKNSAKALACRIPSLVSVQDEKGEESIIALCDISQSGGDHGRIQVVQRTSNDGGKTFGDMKVILSMPVAKAPQSDEYRSSFAIDPIMCQCENGDILLIVDMFPESKAIMQKSWLEKGHGYENINGKMYLGLHSGKTKVGTGKRSGVDKVFTVREKGWVYDEGGNKTKYYVPRNHSAEYAWETMGDMYYAVGDEGEFIEKCPPMMPIEEEGHDIYVGNIYLNYDKGEFSYDKPQRITKRIVSPSFEGELYSKYECVEAGPAPLSVLPSLHLLVMKSKDQGKTWSQPVDITSQVKNDDEIFLGTGPGVAIRLSNQKDKSKNGRILAPVYNLKKTFVIYTDDDGETWHRSECSKNIDETQLIESEEGVVFCFGRQRKLAKTPFSVSRDGGETWTKLPGTALSAVKCQKSFLLLPECSDAFPYAEGMDKSKRYIVSSCTSGHYQKNSNRYGGVVTLGEINGEEIKWLKHRKIITEGINGKWDNFYAYSSLALLKNNEIGLLYEALPGSLIPFRSFTLEWLWKGEKALGFPLKLSAMIQRYFTK